MKIFNQDGTEWSANQLDNDSTDFSSFFNEKRKRFLKRLFIGLLIGSCVALIIDLISVVSSYGAVDSVALQGIISDYVSIKDTPVIKLLRFAPVFIICADRDTEFAQSLYLKGNSGILSGIDASTAQIPIDSGDSIGERGLISYSGEYLFLKISDNPNQWIRFSGQGFW